MNTFGSNFRVTTFGESHGKLIGGVIDGCPAGLKVDKERIKEMLSRRRSKGGLSTERKERDKVHFVSGLLDGVTTGTPLAFFIKNKDVKSKDYKSLTQVFRPSHADYTYFERYGVRDVRGGGRSSARETAVRVVAGAIAMQILELHGISILAYTSQIGRVTLEKEYIDHVTREEIDRSEVGCPIPLIDDAMTQTLMLAKENGDTLGGVVSTVINGVPAGWGSPIYAKLDAKLAEAMMGINAAKGFEVGDGFDIAALEGSKANDPFVSNREGAIDTLTNHSGGIQGGISNGETIRFRVAFKPISSISHAQESIDVDGNPTVVQINGRHDVSVFPRVLPIVEAMSALVLVDELLRTPTYRFPL